MRYFLFIGIFGLMHYYIACAKLVLAVVYCNFLKNFRIDGWGTEGPKALTLGQYVRVCVYHHSVRKWRYKVRFESIYFFVESGLSPSDSTQSQDKSI